jgi:hypothetical protein
MFPFDLIRSKGTDLTELFWCVCVFRPRWDLLWRTLLGLSHSCSDHLLWESHGRLLAEPPFRTGRFHHRVHCCGSANNGRVQGWLFGKPEGKGFLGIFLFFMALLLISTLAAVVLGRRIRKMHRNVGPPIVVGATMTGENLQRASVENQLHRSFLRDASE